MTNYHIPDHYTPCNATIPRSRKQKTIAIISICIVSLIIITIIVVNLLNLSIFSNNIYTPKYTYYLVYTPSSSNELSTTHEEAKNIKMRGGGGNIIHYSPNNLIALHAYFTEEKANEIANSLKEQDINAQILPLHTTLHNITHYNTEERNNAISNIQFIQQLLITLYDIITQFDTLSISENKLYTNIYRLKISCDLELSSLTTLPNFETNPIYIQMLDVTSILQSLCNRDFNGYNLTSISCEFKYSFVQILLSICQKIN